MPQLFNDYFHLSGASLAVGSVIQPGNWGRIIRTVGWRHPEALKEMALENARNTRFSHRPSRLECAFAFVDGDEARNFRARIPGFTHHLLYRVSLLDPDAVSHVTDSRLSGPQLNSLLDDNWADAYWKDFDPATLVIPGIGNWAAVAVHSPGGLQSREMLTLSALRIEECLG
jgi:hypothetical protein